MVFFNYSTMQMSAKVVYYGPGLCGKTTNLQHIYSHTSSGSRGEMVSLETETDRTLFFDLLPLEVGKIQGFKTRIQLYTVPGQVFYNTTRKLVLKGVDGIVFVADSQRAMEQANVDSLDNLRANLDEIGLTFDEVPIVLQYNKRDLTNICTVEEMQASLNRKSWPSFEASALTGEGVFDTLRGISKLTLIGLKKRLSENSRNQGTASSSGASKTSSTVASVPEPTVNVIDDPDPSKAPPKEAGQPARHGESTGFQQRDPSPEPPTTSTFSEDPPKTRKSGVDILAELEKIRQQAQQKSAELGESRSSRPSTEEPDSTDSTDSSMTLEAGAPAKNIGNLVAADDPSGAFEVAAFAAAAKELSEPPGDSSANGVPTEDVPAKDGPAAEPLTHNLEEPLSEQDIPEGLPEIELEFDERASDQMPASEPPLEPASTPARSPDSVTGNGRREIDHSFQFHPTLGSLERAARLSFSLRIEDSNNSVVDTFDEAIQVSDSKSLRHLLLKLRIALAPESSDLSTPDR